MVTVGEEFNVEVIEAMMLDAEDFTIDNVVFQDIQNCVIEGLDNLLGLVVEVGPVEYNILAEIEFETSDKELTRRYW